MSNAEMEPLRGAVEARLEQLLPLAEERPQNLHVAMRYAVLGGGKRFRPLLCLASCESVGGDSRDALDAACAIEFVHCFSLVHDDLPALDDDEVRRGKPTCHVRFGEAVALLAGDALFALAFETLAAMRAPLESKFKAISILAAASGTHGMVGGQTVDIESERKSPEPGLVEWIHERKTGKLIEASCGIGAALGGGDDEAFERCTDFGRHIGLAFQIVDDVLNETGDPEALGKGARTDRTRSKATFPAAEGVSRARERAAAEREKALAAIEPFGPAASRLRALAEFTLSRES